MAVVPRRAMRTTTAPPLEAFSRTVELCNFGIGLVAGFLLVTCAYFSNTKFDAIHIGPLIGPSENQIASPVGTDGSKRQLDLGVSGQDTTLSMEGARTRCWTRTVRTTEATPPRRKVGSVLIWSHPEVSFLITVTLLLVELHVVVDCMDMPDGLIDRFIPVIE
ncbi:uncharacterized protein [Triticum aestivum]|uniref:uncharacterized protein n=1 Tax=Triticum aestivum TaxID=4565 RepID=UPI001D01E11F|nr:uncharacterized protein LOC123071812 [Triticum aestivum]